MQRIVLRHEDERTALDSGASSERRRLTLVFPASVTEYEQARVEIQTSSRPSDETNRGARDKNGCMVPAPSDGAGTADGARYIVTTNEQRRAWDLPDLADTTIAHDTVPGDPNTIASRDVVPVVDATEAIDLEDDDGSDDGATVNDAGCLRCRRFVRLDSTPHFQKRGFLGSVGDLRRRRCCCRCRSRTQWVLLGGWPSAGSGSAAGRVAPRGARR